MEPDPDTSGSGGAARRNRQLIAQTALFAPMAPADIDALLARSYERPMRAGETLFQRGDPGVSMMAIIAGEVRIVLPGETGRDQTLNVLKTGAVFGEIALFDGNPRSADAVAATNGRLLVLERQGVMRLIEQDPGFALRMIGVIAQRLRSTLSQLDAVLFRDVPSRIDMFLLEASRAQGHPRVDITQAALGETVGAARETVNRHLRQRAADGAIALSPGRITVLDPQRLLPAVRAPRSAAS